MATTKEKVTIVVKPDFISGMLTDFSSFRFEYLFCHDSLKRLKRFKDNSIDCVVTSPPYFRLRQYILPNGVNDQIGREHYLHHYINSLKEVFAEIYRVLKPSGTLWVNIGTTYEEKVDLQVPQKFSLMMTHELNFLMRNMIIWYKNNALPKGAPDRMSFSWEPIYLFSKSKKYYFQKMFEPYSDKSSGNLIKPYEGMPRKNYKKVGAQNPSDTKRRIIETMKKRGGRALRDVWIINTQPNPTSHTSAFPRELVRRCLTMGCPPYVCDTCKKPAMPVMDPSDEYKALLGKSWTPEQDKSKDDRLVAGFTKTKGKQYACCSDYHLTGWEVCDCEAKFIPGVVLDPFAGSMTVGVVAKQLRRAYIMIEFSQESFNEGKQWLDTFTLGEGADAYE